MSTYEFQQFAYNAARDLGGIRAGQTLSNDVLNDMMAACNDMLDSWALEDTIVPAAPPQVFTLSEGVQIYTIGPNEVSPNFTAPRPNLILDANIILNTFSPVLRRPLDVINVDQWADIRVQSLPDAIPDRLYFERSFYDATNQPTAAQWVAGVGAGAAQMYFWPGPLTNYQFEIYTTDTVILQQFTSLTQSMSYPPGYALAIRKNLAVQCAPLLSMYSKAERMGEGRILMPAAERFAEVRRQAIEALDRVTSSNAPDPILTYDAAFTGNSKRAGLFNYLTGTNGRGGP